MTLLGLAWQFRKPLGYLLAVLAVVGAISAAVLWHAGKVRAFGAERYAAGQAERQAAWDKAVANAALARAAELRRASEDLSMRDLQQMQAEEADDARFQKLNDDLARALAAHVSDPIPRIPGELLRARRALNPGAP